MNKVFVAVIDGLKWPVIAEAIDSGALPNLRDLSEQGARQPCLSVFPSITPAATTSIGTGAYPSGHGIAGGCWVDRENNQFAYYGDDPWVILHEGMQTFLDSFLVKLNKDRLDRESMFDRCEQAGGKAACINFPCHAGRHRHPVESPMLFRLAPGVSLADHTNGPTYLFLGDFVRSATPDGGPIEHIGGVLHRFGFHDDTTIAMTEADLTPRGSADLTVAYYPNNDFESHSRGPLAALETVVKVDEHLGRLFEAFGGIDQFLEQFAVVVVGDHGHCDLVDDPSRREIDLTLALADFQLAMPGDELTGEHELAICPNMRAAQVVLNEAKAVDREKVIATLLGDNRVDQVAALDSDGVWSVRTRTRGVLAFRASGDRDAPETTIYGGNQGTGCTDEYGNSWTITGDLRVLDLTVGDDGRIEYGQYPNALERIANVAFPHPGTLWATALPGYEFSCERMSAHGKSSHGALHEDDSRTVLVTAGFDAADLPATPRIIDIAGLAIGQLTRASPGVASAP